jgi:hypothetical protein
MSYRNLVAVAVLCGLVAPARGEAILPVEQSTINQTHVQFSWLAVAKPTAYELQVVVDSGAPDPFDGVVPVVDELVLGEQTYTVVKSGLEFGRDYAWRVRGFSGGFLDWGATHRFSTAPLPDYTPATSVIRGAGPVEPGVTLVDVLFSFAAPPPDRGFAMAVDESGAPVWFYVFPELVQDIRLLDNGRMLFQTFQHFRAYEIELDGTVTWESHPDLLVHHEVFPMPNGNFLALLYSFQDVMRDSELQPWFGDRIVEIDRQSNVLWSWDTFDHYSTLDFDEVIMENPGAFDAYDWTHGNAAIYNEADNSVYFSARHLNRITRIDYDTGEIVYNMGFESPSGEDDFGHNLFSFQHAPQMLPNGNMMVYDNGNRRDGIDHDTAGTGVSKAIELAFTEGPTPTDASIVWEWTLPEYTSFVGDADRLPGGNTLITAGPSLALHEVDAAGSEVWSLELSQQGAYAPFIMYRAERIPELVIPNTCPNDVADPPGVEFRDLLQVLLEWGEVGVSTDFVPPLGVGFEDLLQVLNNWGECP